MYGQWNDGGRLIEEDKISFSQEKHQFTSLQSKRLVKEQ
jgi:hypothetical protein